MRILMSGATGLIGTALSGHLVAEGHTVTRLVRREAKAGEITWDPAAGVLDEAAFDGCDAVINLSGAGIGDRRWSEEYKHELLSSRVQATELLANHSTPTSRRVVPRTSIGGTEIAATSDATTRQAAKTSQRSLLAGRPLRCRGEGASVRPPAPASCVRAGAALKKS